MNNNNSRLEILYVDKYLGVVNKPCGLLSVPYGGSKGKTAQSILEELLRKQGKANGKHKPFAVHRLDRDTSGVMVFALTELSQKKLMDNWHKIVTERLYRAVAENPLNKKLILPDSGLIDDPLAMNAYHVGYVPKSNVDKDGKIIETVVARTNYKILKRGISHSLFELSLDTGKKNQIRAHLAGRGYPLSGDFEHRGHDNPFGRLCLHARTLEFKHPFTGEILKFEVEEPKEWISFVEKGDSRLLNEKKNRPNRSQKKDFDERNGLSNKDRVVSRKELSHMNYIQRGKAHR